jgi:mannose/fructose/N-acetylgalactosamine-specific phosphotransferase system component IIC
MVNHRPAAVIPAALVAHQGGWDEMLLVAVPIAVVAGLLWLARRRVTRGQQHASDHPDHPSI